MKSKLNFFLIILVIIFSSCFNIEFENATIEEDKNKGTSYSNNDSLYLSRIVTYKNILDTLEKIKGIKKIYLFSYNCSPCRHSIKSNTYSKYVVNDSISFLPTILINCDNYYMFPKLNRLLIDNKVKGVITLNNEDFKSKSFIGSFDRLENFVKKYFPITKGKYQFGYPYNIILDSNNNIIEEYPGAFD